MRLPLVSVSLCLCASLLGCGRVGYEVSFPDGPEDHDAAPFDVAPGRDRGPLADAGAADNREDTLVPDTRPEDVAVDAPALDAGTADAPAADGPSPDVPPPDTMPPVDVTDAAPDAAPARQGCYARYPTALFCEDFENGLPGTVGDYRYVAPRGGSVTLETGIARGTTSARLVPGSPGGTGLARAAYFSKHLEAPVTGGEVFLRIFQYVPSGFDVVEFIVNAELANDPARIKVSQGISSVRFEVSTAGHSEVTAGWPRDRWFCFEVAVRVAGAGRAEFLVDGVSRSVVPMGNTLPSGGWDHLNFGMIADERTTGSQTIIDDVVLSTTRVGCAQ